MAGFTLPAEEPRYSIEIESFRGVDLNNSPSNVHISRSPDAPNMIRDQVGKVRKRMGYTTEHQFEDGDGTPIGAVHGVYSLKDKRLFHCGTALYCKTGEAYVHLADDMADRTSRAFVYNERLYILDGSVYRVFDGETVRPVSEDAYIPTVIIGRAPSGGGTPYDGFNLIGSGWREEFCGTAADTVYQLTETDLDATPVQAEVLNAAGDWVEKSEGVDFTVDRALGTVTFHAAPGASPVSGVDNVRITAYKTRAEYAARINGCRIAATYGVGGAMDRVFLTGCPSFPGMDWYSGYDDPTYFSDINYTQVARNGAEIVGYAILNAQLAALLSSSSDGRNAVVRTGSLDDDGNALFRITNTLMGEAAVAPWSFAYMGKEPLFLTDRGVYAITAEELTGEKYTQERSYYIAKRLMELPSRREAVAIVWRDFYVLSDGEDIYLLDGLQRSYEKDSPYSSYQYEAYYWTDIGATALWVEGERLCFGTADGRVCAFATNVDFPESYNDDGRPIDAYWETPDISGKAFYHNKTFVSVAVRLAAAPLTGVKIYALTRGNWSQVFDAGAKARYFDWEYIDFAKFTFSSDRTPRTLVGKIKKKKVDKIRFRLRNAELNEGFGIYLFGTEWMEPGSNYKR